MLKHLPYPTYRQIRHVIVVWAIETIALLALEKILPGLEIQSSESAILAVALIGLLNAILRPVILYFTITITVFTLGLFSLLINVAVILLVVQIVPGFIILNNQTAILVVLGVTFINMLITQILSLDENNSYYRSVIRRLGRTQSRNNSAVEHAMLIIQFDGLSYSVLESALRAGYMPTIESLISDQHYQLKKWICGLPSQTSSSQLGIMYGDNKNVPAFRWYEKETQKLVVSNHLNDTAMIESRVDQKDSLLLHNGSSIANMFSGNAVKSAMTMSQLTSVAQISKRSNVFYNFFLNPYNYTHTVFLFIGEMFREMYQNLAKLFSHRQLSLRRSFLFALERAMAVVFARELTTHIIIEDMFSKYQTIYATYMGYDVVAHHTGIDSPAALSVMRGLDKQIQRVIKANEIISKVYTIVVLSDHGQSQGSTFRQLYGLTLDQLLKKYLQNEKSVVSSGTSDEVKGYVNSLLQEVLNPHQKVNQSVKRIYKQLQTKDGDFSYFDSASRPLPSGTDIIVCPSGNMALVYFANFPERLSLEQISKIYPHLLVNLVSHPGIAFVMLNSEEYGPILLHSNGMYFLKSQRIEGKDILSQYPSHTSAQLQKLSAFPNCGDMVIFSSYNPETKMSPAFEELIGHHGGIGGLQTEAFAFFPESLPWRPGISDAVELHKQLREWQTLIFEGQQ
ncbi:MAG: hypothetical protein BGO78_08455 [Chloroflexi bacterium 44-23]|nr:MAG: hypothetical protein BGO78_08455 [Chloroflexi bacterium 44-23]